VYYGADFNCKCECGVRKAYWIILENKISQQMFWLTAFYGVVHLYIFIYVSFFNQEDPIDISQSLLSGRPGQDGSTYSST